MAIVRPFRALRPSKLFAEKVVVPPYDVLDDAMCRAYAQDNPYSFIRISRSEVDFPVGHDPYAYEVYEKAAMNINDFLRDGVLIEDDKPMVYIYKQTMGQSTQVGVVACVSVDDYKNNIIKKHELTRVEKEIDRINHFDICKANTEPVFLAYRDNDKITNMVDKYIYGRSPEYHLETEDEVIHELYPVFDTNVVDGICGLFNNVPELYIADGHHRSASAAKVGEKCRKQRPGYTGQEEFNFFMAVIFPGSQLHITGYHRIIKDLNGLSSEEFIEKLIGAGFDVEKVAVEGRLPNKEHELSMYLDECWYNVKISNNIIPEDVVGSLDVAILQERVLSPILGIDDPRRDKRISFVGGLHSAASIKKELEENDGKLAFIMYPVDIEHIFNISDESCVMPPKSTWFEPKLASGLFVHSFIQNRRNLEEESIK